MIPRTVELVGVPVEPGNASGYAVAVRKPHLLRQRIGGPPASAAASLWLRITRCWPEGHVAQGDGIGGFFCARCSAGLQLDLGHVPAVRRVYARRRGVMVATGEGA